MRNNTDYIYVPITKKVIDEKNNEHVKCAFEGTSKCQIHNESGCTNCPVFKAILTHLNAFENIYLSDDDEEELSL